VAAEWPAMHSAHWDEVWQAITDTEPLPVERVTAHPIVGEVDPKLPGLLAVDAIATEHLEVLSEVQQYAIGLRDALDARTAETKRDVATVSEALAVTATGVDALEQQVVALDIHRAIIEAENIELVDATDHAEQAAARARALIAELRQRLDGRDEQIAQLRPAL